MVGFTSICTQISPMDVAKMLNAMYMTFDSLISNRKSVYKVKNHNTQLAKMNIEHFLIRG